MENNKTSDMNIQICRDNFGPISRYVGGNQINYAPEQKQYLEGPVKEIKELLEQLEKSYPTKKLSEQAIVAEKALEKIEADKNWKNKVITSVKVMGIEAFMEIIDNPIANVLRAGIESWIEGDSN